MTKPVSRPAKRPRHPGTPAAAPTRRQPGKAPKTAKNATARRHFAIIGAGMAGVVCARTLVQAGAPDADGLTLLAPHNAAAAKLRQLAPALLAALDGAGHPVNAIRVKVLRSTP